MLRRYPNPGKYEGGLVIDELAHLMSMDGCDDELGDVSEHGEWHGLIRGPFSPHDMVTHELELSDEEVIFVRTSVGAIIMEDSQGFVTVEWFNDAFRMDRTWNRMVKEFAANCEDEDNDATIPDPPHSWTHIESD